MGDLFQTVKLSGLDSYCWLIRQTQGPDFVHSDEPSCRIFRNRNSLCQNASPCPKSMVKSFERASASVRSRREGYRAADCQPARRYGRQPDGRRESGISDSWPSSLPCNSWKRPSSSWRAEKVPVQLRVAVCCSGLPAGLRGTHRAESPATGEKHVEDFGKAGPADAHRTPCGHTEEVEEELRNFVRNRALLGV